jgi:hypothetical protein
MGVMTLTCCRIKRRFAKTIIHQHQPVIDQAKFRQTDGLGTYVDSDEARRCWHWLKL